MDFRLTQDQIDLRDAVRDYLAGEHGPEVLRRLDVEGGRDAALWQVLAGTGRKFASLRGPHGHDERRQDEADPQHDRSG